MPRTKKNYERFINSSIHNPPEIFYYDDKEYIVYCNLIDTCNINIEYSRTNSFKIWTETRFIKDYYIMPSDKRIQTVEDVRLIKNWMNENKISGNWNEWSKVVMPIIKFFEISKDKRQELFHKFRSSLLRKLEDNIKSIDKLLKVSTPIWQNLIIEREILKLRKEIYEKIKSRIKNERAGEYKFLYPVIRPLFDKLKDIKLKDANQKELKTSDICRIVCNLFKVGNFDNFEKYFSINKREALNKIGKIRTEAYGIKAKSKMSYVSNNICFP